MFPLNAEHVYLIVRQAAFLVVHLEREPPPESGHASLKL